MYRFQCVEHEGPSLLRCAVDKESESATISDQLGFAIIQISQNEVK